MDLTQPFGDPKEGPKPSKFFRSGGSTEGDDFCPGSEEGNE